MTTINLPAQDASIKKEWQERKEAPAPGSYIEVAFSLYAKPGQVRIYAFDGDRNSVSLAVDEPELERLQDAIYKARFELKVSREKYQKKSNTVAW